MGMAASQARLLSLTARINDVEYQAQAIQNAKLGLATRSDQVYEEYVAALDATTLTVNKLNTDGTSSRIAATYNNLFSRNKVQAADGSNYVLLDNKGRLIVSDEIYEGYLGAKELGITNAYAFAVFMMADKNYNVNGSIDGINSFMTEVVRGGELTYLELKNEGYGNNSGLSDYYNELLDLTQTDSITDTSKIANDEEKMKKYNSTLALFQKALYNGYSEKAYKKTVAYSKYETWTNESDFKYYHDMFTQIQSCNGCVPISSYDGSFGNASNNTEWLQGMVQSGQLSIMTIDKEPDENGYLRMRAAAPSSDTSLAYSQTSEIDNTALAKAEAKYEHDLKEIEKKDKDFDLSLSKLETERSALTKELDSVKNVIKENIDRSFKIFS